MDPLSFKLFDILDTGTKRYRIIYIQNDRVVGCLMDTTKLILDYFAMQLIKENLMSGEWKAESDESAKLVDEDTLPEPYKTKYILYRNCIRDVEKVYGPSFIGLSGKTKKPELTAILKKYGISTFVFWKICRGYLQGGCRDSSLVDNHAPGFARSGQAYHYKKRTGRPAEYGVQSSVIVNDEIRSYFAEALSAYTKGRQNSYKGAYEDMLKKHFTIQHIKDGTVSWDYLPRDQMPTYTQFYNYAKKELSQEEKDAVKSSRMEQRNNKRLLLSDSMKGVKGSGDTVEVDALETDISLVSERDREQTIGRGILYLMIDVWTRAIIAISVGFENNSVLACTDLFLNLADDKVAYAKKYGIDFPPELWPSNIIPRRMRMDRGADFRSDKLKGILNGLGVERILEPAATGSMKGIVEQEFHQIQFNQNDIMENKGLIEKRHDSNHHREAELTIHEFTAMCINYVLSHNQKHLTYFKVNKKMQDAGVEPIPVKLWEYGCRVYGAPRPIADKQQFLWNLLTPAKAGLNREGIKWKGLYYLNSSDKMLLHEMYIQQNKVKKIDVKFDPRDIGRLYYLRDGMLMTAPLNPDKFRNEGYDGMTYAEYLDYYKAMKQSNADGKWHNTTVSINERSINRQIESSVSSARYSDPEGMREKRNEEKQEVNRKNAVSRRLSDHQAVQNQISQDEEKPVAQDKHILEDKKQEDDDLDFENALKKFAEDH